MWGQRQKHLTPVLELGSKVPCIDGQNGERGPVPAARVTWGRASTAGRHCVAINLLGAQAWRDDFVRQAGHTSHRVRRGHPRVRRIFCCGQPTPATSDADDGASQGIATRMPVAAFGSGHRQRRRARRASTRKTPPRAGVTLDDEVIRQGDFPAARAASYRTRYCGTFAGRGVPYHARTPVAEKPLFYLTCSSDDQTGSSNASSRCCHSTDALRPATIVIHWPTTTPGGFRRRG